MNTKNAKKYKDADAEWILKNKHFALFDYKFSAGSLIFDSPSFKLVIKYGKLDALKYIYKQSDRALIFSFMNAMDYAIKSGHLEIVKFLHENRTGGCIELIKTFDGIEKCDENVMDQAFENDRTDQEMLEVIKYLHENGMGGCTDRAMDSAARKGHLEVVKFLHKNRTEGCSDWAMDMAAKEGHLDMVKFLHENRSEGDPENAVIWALGSGRYEVADYLYENRRGNERVMSVAKYKAINGLN